VASVDWIPPWDLAEYKTTTPQVGTPSKKGGGPDLHGRASLACSRCERELVPAKVSQPASPHVVARPLQAYPSVLGAKQLRGSSRESIQAHAFVRRAVAIPGNIDSREGPGRLINIFSKTI